MLSQLNYNQLWTVNLGQSLQNIPCYYQYLQREVYFQDYLDLFGYPNDGNPTFERLIIEGKQTVFIQGLCEDPNSEFTMKDQNGEIRLIVNYDFPFDKAELCKGREIKYILIGEAAHSVSDTYFYNINHTKDTLYFSQPVKALGMASSEKNKIQKKTNELFSLAQNGVLLLDLLPYKANYSLIVNEGGERNSLRKVICNSGAINFFWDNPTSPYSAVNRLNEINDFLSNKWDLSFMAPCELSVFLINLNPLNISTNGLHQESFRSIAPNIKRCTKGRNYLKITINSSNQGPSASLIRNSFGLNS